MAKKQGYGEKAVKIMELLNTTNKSDHQIAYATGSHVTYVKALRRKMAHKAEELKITSDGADTNVDVILDKRGEQYGSFMQSSDTAVKIKGAIHNALARNDTHMFPDQMIALDMIALKISRIVNGNAAHLDSWVDIAGYAKLVADRLQGNVR
jgi:predicted HAD superfamily Cof-like phosphohydrolase